MYRVNALQVIYLLKALTKKMLDREKRCGVLVTSSQASDVIMAGSASYSSSKALVSNFCEAVHFELKKNVDVTVWTPGSVSSNIHVIIGESSFYTVGTTRAVAAALS